MHKEVEILCNEILELKQELRKDNKKLEKIKEYCNETMRVMNNCTGNNPYAQGRTVEASRVLEIIKEE